MPEQVVVVMSKLLLRVKQASVAVFLDTGNVSDSALSLQPS